MLIVAEFRDSIVVAIPQCTTPFCDVDQDAYVAGPTEKLLEKGKIFTFAVSMLLEKEWMAPTCTATIMEPHHELLASHMAFI